MYTNVIVVGERGGASISKTIDTLRSYGCNVSIVKNLTVAACQHPDVIIVIGSGKDHLDQLVYLARMDNLPIIFWLYNPILGDSYPSGYPFITKIFNRAVLSYKKHLLYFFKDPVSSKSSKLH